MSVSILGFRITGKLPCHGDVKGCCMVTRVMQNVALTGLTVLMLTGCGRQVSQRSAQDLNLLATSPDPKVLPKPRPFVTAAFDATGGLAAWQQCTKVEFHAAVTACERDGCFYLTEHDFVLCPWSDAIQVTATEPRAHFTWQMISGRYHTPADPNLDVSPLKGLERDYADAVLQIATAPVRMLQDNMEFTVAPAAVQVAGQWYLPINARYQTPRPASKKGATPEPYWTRGTYFQSQDRPLVDMIWLGNPDTHKFILVRGYDYATIAGSIILMPTKIEVFQSDPDANIGPRLALVDLGR